MPCYDPSDEEMRYAELKMDNHKNTTRMTDKIHLLTSYLCRQCEMPGNLVHPDVVEWWDAHQARDKAMVRLFAEQEQDLLNRKIAEKMAFLADLKKEQTDVEELIADLKKENT
jgi:hypothetical protein